MTIILGMQNMPGIPLAVYLDQPGQSITRLARDLGMSQTAVSGMKHREIYIHVRPCGKVAAYEWVKLPQRKRKRKSA